MRYILVNFFSPVFFLGVKCIVDRDLPAIIGLQVAITYPLFLPRSRGEMSNKCITQQHLQIHALLFPF